MKYISDIAIKIKQGKNWVDKENSLVEITDTSDNSVKVCKYNSVIMNPCHFYSDIWDIIGRPVAQLESDTRSSFTPRELGYAVVDPYDKFYQNLNQYFELSVYTETHVLDIHDTASDLTYYGDITGAEYLNLAVKGKTLTVSISNSSFKWKKIFSLTLTEYRVIYNYKDITDGKMHTASYVAHEPSKETEYDDWVYHNAVIEWPAHNSGGIANVKVSKKYEGILLSRIESPML